MPVPFALQKDQLKAAADLRQKVLGTITLPDMDLSGIPYLQIGSMIDLLIDIERRTGDSATHKPFAETRADSPHCVWLRQPGLVLETIAAWAERQLERIHTHVEASVPDGKVESEEREMLLLTWYARTGQHAKAVALLAGWATPEPMKDVIEAVADGRERIDVLRMMVEGSSLSTPEKNAFHQAVRSADETFGEVEGCLKDLHDAARQSA